MSSGIHESVKEWLACASTDWRTVEILVSDPYAPPETVCFHCQQYVEKLLKTLLTWQSIEFPKTHFLPRLIELAAPKAPALLSLLNASDALSAHAVQTRYPAAWRTVDEHEMRQMIDLAKQFEQIIMPLIPK